MGSKVKVTIGDQVKVDGVAHCELTINPDSKLASGTIEFQNVDVEYIKNDADEGGISQEDLKLAKK